jgi:hypothetical protein
MKSADYSDVLLNNLESECMKVFSFGVFVCGAYPLASMAQELVSELRVSDLVNTCVTALDGGGDAKPYAEELLSREGFNLGPDNRAKGERCLEEVYNVDFVLEGGKFSSPELAAIRQAEQAERERRYDLEVVNVCFEEYHIDRFRALTTPVCGSIFKSIGLP